MLCPYCQKEETKVIDSRETENFEATRRRRECLKCSKRFTTYERVETDLKVIKKDGSTQQYNRDKLIRSISIPCEKRPIDEETINQITNRIEAVLRNKPKSEVTSKVIGELSMRALKKLDKIAYIRFASVYRDFEDIESFEAELIKLKK
ncbi:transcriptional repressor NrdR [Candidatus Woesearchaeota archaeon]|nr:transcriptional repressor NrdR [Candidatus Woesearchaeota archaeon]MBT5215532.1 transcriptional repressor NrdR [Candidatus Woesearchaeota archaeon]MBT6402253.1 transcriptional repressor NrdR [Candidatus Woesearchaeota archaeon]